MSRLLIVLVSLISIIRPPFLKTGDKVAIVSPSFAPMDTAAFNKGIKVIEIVRGACHYIYTYPQKGKVINTRGILYV